MLDKSFFNECTFDCVVESKLEDLMIKPVEYSIGFYFVKIHRIEKLMNII